MSIVRMDGDMPEAPEEVNFRKIFRIAEFVEKIFRMREWKFILDSLPV